jgi:hypothetical protein
LFFHSSSCQVPVFTLQGIKVICEFIDLQGCRTINVVDTDAKGLVASRAAWVDILAFETFPVYPFGESKGLNKT